MLEPTGEFWHREDGLALTWTMSATQTEAKLGEEYVGRRWTVDGMSFVVFDGDLVSLEVDYHDGGARLRSLQAAASVLEADISRTHTSASSSASSLEE